MNQTGDMATPQRIGPYTIESELGRGGLSVVYHAHNPRDGREVALKVLPRELVQGPTFRVRFEREAKLIQSLDHEALVPVYDFGEDNLLFYVAMRYLRGGALPERIADGPMPLAEATRILQRIAPALDHAHANGVLHRNLRAGSILFDEQGQALLSDFGIVTLPEVAADVPPGVVMQTLAYMSPEQIRKEDLTPRADVYSLGVILFEMLTGERPYSANNPQALGRQHLAKPVPAVRETLLGFQLGPQSARVSSQLPPPAIVDEVLFRALAKNPAERFESAGAMLAALQTGDAAPSPQPVAPGATVSASSAATPPPRPRRGGWLLNVLIAFLFIAALGMCALLVANAGLLSDLVGNLPGGTVSQALPLTQTHSSGALGFSVGLPEGWLSDDGASFGFPGDPTGFTLAAEDREAYNAVVSIITEGGFRLEGPVFVGMVRSLEGLPDAAIQPRPLLAVFKEEGPMLDFETGPTRTTRVGGERAAWANFTGADPASGQPLAGRMVAVVWAGHAGFFVGAAPAGEWDAYAPTFDAMLDSAELFNPTAIMGAGLAPFEPDVLAVEDGGDFTGGDGYETAASWAIGVNGSIEQWTLEDGFHADNWTFDGGTGWDVTITVRSLDQDYDPYVTLIGPSGAVIGSDDDSGDGQFGRDSQLTVRLPESGPYVARVSAYGVDGGDYEISVTSP